MDPRLLEYLRDAGYFVAFLFLLCGAVRLARFNIQKNPMPKNPGRPDRKYFVGLPIPAAAVGGGGGDLRGGQRAAALLDGFGAVAGAAGTAVVPDGEHLALSQLQGSESDASALAAEYYSDGRAHFSDLEFFAAGAAGPGDRLRGRRHRDSHWRGGAAAFAPQPRRRRNRSIKLAEKAARARVALVGGDTLLAKEIRELLEHGEARAARRDDLGRRGERGHAGRGR